jgi:hypothetical protein
LGVPREECGVVVDILCHFHVLEEKMDEASGKPMHLVPKASPAAGWRLYQSRALRPGISQKMPAKRVTMWVSTSIMGSSFQTKVGWSIEGLSALEAITLTLRNVLSS